MIKKSKPSGGKPTLKERLAKKREKIRKNGEGKGNIIFIKADTTLRARLLPLSPEEDFTYEIVQFYLGNDIKGVISPATFGEPCPIMEKYEELKASKDPDDKDTAKLLVPKRKFLALVNIYKDLKGKEVDPDNAEKLILLPGGIAQQLIDSYLDEDDWGDMTNPKTGYDVKIKRVGSGKMDTEYTVTNCNKTPLAKAYNKVYSLEAEVRKQIPSYDDAKDLLEQFLSGNAPATKDDDDAPSRPKKKIKKSRLG